MFSKQQIDGFEKVWRRRKPGSSTALHYASDIRIFFMWAEGQPPEAITMHDVDEFIGWQQDLGSAQATIRRRLIALRMFYDYLAYVCQEGIDNPVITQRHYIDQGHHLPRDIRQIEFDKLFAAIGDHLRDHTIFTLMLHTGMRVGEAVSLRLAEVFLCENGPPYRFLRLKQRNWPAKTVRRSTRQLFSRLNHITTFFIQHYAWSEWKQLAPHWLEYYIVARLREGMSPGTINWDLIYFRALCQLIVEEGYEVTNAILTLKVLDTPQRLPRPLATEQVRLL